MLPHLAIHRKHTIYIKIKVKIKDEFKVKIKIKNTRNRAENVILPREHALSTVKHQLRCPVLSMMI